jgi:D-glycero-D-manno-heptose 1,7-bisphosphate phosphatase
MMGLNKAVFIDRDGVINSDEGHYYIFKVEDFKLNPDIVEGLKLLQDAGFLLVVITNQGGVAKGIYTHTDVALVHGYMASELGKHGIALTDVFYCPHHESVAACDCRKPSPKMILDACQKHHINPNTSFLIGDSARDIEAGNAAGLKNCYKIDANSSILGACKQIINTQP